MTDEIPADGLTVSISWFREAGTGRILGGTIYFAVFQNTGKAGDALGIRENFNSVFVEGENIRKEVSPAFDTEAEFLYLYQVVNDRAIHDPKLNKANPAGIMTAANPQNDKINLTEDIASFSLGLTCDPRYITSWGYFADTGFSIRVLAEKGERRTSRPYAWPCPATP